jgi:hypothetical protein
MIQASYAGRGVGAGGGQHQSYFQNLLNRGRIDPYRPHILADVGLLLWNQILPSLPRHLVKVGFADTQLPRQTLDQCLRWGHLRVALAH